MTGLDITQLSQTNATLQYMYSTDNQFQVIVFAAVFSR